MRIKMIFPENERMLRTRIQRKAAPAPPLSLGYLAAMVPPDTEIEFIDIGQGDNPNCDSAIEDETDLVAIHVRTPVATTAFRIADKFRSQGVKVVMGGPHPTLLPEECRRHSDAVCIGEGEEAWPAMINDLITGGNLKDYYIGGPYNTDYLNGEIQKFPLRSDLRNLPIPRRDLFPQGRYKLQGVFLSRGCPYDCKFCSVKNLQGAKVRLRPLEEILKEISGIEGPIFFAEENATGIPSTADYHLALFQRMTSMGIERNWSGGSTLGMASDARGRKVLEAAARSGLCFAFIGFETLSRISAQNTGVLSKLGQSRAETFDRKKLGELVRIYYDLGIYVMGYFIVGLDDDTEETYKRIIDFCDSTLVMPMFTMLAPMPGTQLYQEYARNRRFREGINWDDFGSDTPVFHHPNFSASELNRHYQNLWEQAYTLNRVAIRNNFVNKRFSLKTLDITQGVQSSVRQVFELKT